MDLNPDELSFLGEIETDLDDNTARLIYADWLQERGDVRGEYLRTEVALASGGGEIKDLEAAVVRIEQLKSEIDSDWLALVSRSAIEGCYKSYLESRDCPGRWRALPRTDQPRIRVCETCEKAVLFCENVKEAKYYLNRNLGVAIEASCERSVDDLEGRFFEPERSGEANVDELQGRVIEAEAITASILGPSRSRSRRNWLRDLWS